MDLYMILATAANEVATQPVHNIPKVLVVIAVIALIVGLIRILCLKGQLTSVHKSESAADYTRDNSFKLETKRDLFLYSKTEKKEKPQSEANK